MDYYYDDMGMSGVYTPDTQFDLDPYMLRSIGFTEEEMATVQYIVMNGGKVTVNNLVTYCGVDYEEAKKLKYMYDICTGRVSIQTQDDLAKHLKKMFGQHQRIGIQHLEVKLIRQIPRKALVGNIPKNLPFHIWNSINYPPTDRMYDVVDVSGRNIIISTNRIPVLKYKESKSAEGICEIREGPINGKLTVAINKDYCKLCNRFVIAASLRYPKNHHGLIEIICIEGTKVYVFADTVSAKKYDRFGNNSQRVYDFGFYPFEIERKLYENASEIYKKLCGVHATYTPGVVDFELISKDMPEEEDDEVIADMDLNESIDSSNFDE